MISRSFNTVATIILFPVDGIIIFENTVNIIYDIYSTAHIKYRNHNKLRAACVLRAVHMWRYLKCIAREWSLGRLEEKAFSLSPTARPLSSLPSVVSYLSTPMEGRGGEREGGRGAHRTTIIIAYMYHNIILCRHDIVQRHVV